MPLIVVTGLPCSGKTHRAQQIALYLTERIRDDPSSSKRKVQVINSHHASSDTPYQSETVTVSDLRDKIYNSAAQEKTARAEEFSAIKRAVSKDTIVIADGLNYIKGYRYQLWCEAKAAGTRSCVVHVAAQEDECTEWNRERLRAWDRESENKISEPDQPQQGRTGNKIGQSTFGDLVPESHTAVYGDRIVEKVSRSRSSSTDGQDGEQAANAQKPEDTMTLKSLYISNKPTSTEARTPRPLSKVQSEQTSSTNKIPLPTNPIPPPTSSPPYSPSTLQSLQMRYEPPSPFSRWDTPLFTIPSTDAHPPYEAIYLALFPAPVKSTSKKALSQSQTQPHLSSSTENGITQQREKVEAVKQHAATVLPPATSADALQMIESTTLEVIRALLVCARESGVSSDTQNNGDDEVVLSFAIPEHISSAASDSNQDVNGTTIRIDLPVPKNTTLNQPLLQRLRRKYTAMQRGGIAHGQGYVSGGRRGVVEGFVRFLDAELNG